MPITPEFAERRRRFMQRMGPAVALFPAAPVFVRNNDVNHAYRQGSDLYYLAGFEEPDSVLLLTNRHPEHRMVMFVRPRDEEREVWDGPRAGCEGAKRDYGADEAFPIGELPKRLPDYLTDVPRLYYRTGVDRAFDDQVFEAVNAVRKKIRTMVVAPREIVDTAALLHEERLRKSERDLELMSRAEEITRDAHRRAMESARPGMYEYEVEAELQRVFTAGGSRRPAYESVVASGPNATILHYQKNDRLMEDGDLLLIDAGAEYAYYASDVTRTFPVNGRFTDAQRAVYQTVLDAQQAAIEKVRPGVTLDDVHDAAVGELVRGLRKHGIVAGSEREIIDKGTYKPFYMHRTSHWLGMDVHDVGDYGVEGKARPLETGFVLTVEPGLYFSPAADVDRKWRGIGVRIEDNLVVTGEGYRNLTADIPKNAGELERIVRSGR
jgi:Xaa-Pro aminopeptidase